MKKSLLFLAPLLVGAGAAVAQIPNPGGTNPTARPVADSVASLKRKLNVNVLLRSSLEIPNASQGQAAFRLNEARFEVRGDLLPQLSYRVRYRLNQLAAPRNTLDNAPGSLDIADATYRFGPDSKWNLTAGKQAAMVGSWEFENNPTFEYQYSEYVNYQLNLFPLSAKLGYDINKNQAVLVQLYNTSNNSLQNGLQTTGYAGGLAAPRAPMGVYVSWLGKFFDQHFLTFYSYNVSQFAKDQTNQSLSLGNKVVFKKFSAYLDLATTNVGVDYFNLASPALNKYEGTMSPTYLPTYGQNLNYKNAVLRLDYQFVPGWFVTAKGFYETASQRDGGPAGRNFRQNIGYLGGLEYKPVQSQDLKFFAYYFQHNLNYYNAVAATTPSQSNQLLAVGVLYFIQALK